MGKSLIAFGVLLVLVGVAWQLGVHKYIPIGKLPGDLVFDKGNTKVYLPITSCIIISVILSVIFRLLRKIF